MIVRTGVQRRVFSIFVASWDDDPADLKGLSQISGIDAERCGLAPWLQSKLATGWGIIVSDRLKRNRYVSCSFEASSKE